MMKMVKVLPCMVDWWEQHKPQPEAARPFVPRKERVYLPITDEERRAIDSLAGCRFGSMSSVPKYVAGLKKANRVSEGGRHLLWRWVWRYRRQINDKSLVKLAEIRERTK
jgi:hypothetical protein